MLTEPAASRSASAFDSMSTRERKSAHACPACSLHEKSRRGRRVLLEALQRRSPRAEAELRNFFHYRSAARVRLFGNPDADVRIAADRLEAAELVDSIEDEYTCCHATQNFEAGNFPEPSKRPNEIVRFENAAQMPNLEQLIRDRDRLIQKVLPEIIWAQGS